MVLIVMCVSLNCIMLKVYKDNMKSNFFVMIVLFIVTLRKLFKRKQIDKLKIKIAYVKKTRARIACIILFDETF